MGFGNAFLCKMHEDVIVYNDRNNNKIIIKIDIFLPRRFKHTRQLQKR